jgi:hypothetical protein
MKGFQNRHYEVITAATDDYDSLMAKVLMLMIM